MPKKPAAKPTTHTVLISLIRSREDDEKLAAARYPGLDLDKAIYHLVQQELAQCTNTQRLTGTPTIVAVTGLE